MSAIKIFKTTTLPATLEGHSIYLVAPTSKPNYVEIFVTNADASVAKRVINANDVQSMIDDAITVNNTEIVDDIIARTTLLMLL